MLIRDPNNNIDINHFTFVVLLLKVDPMSVRAKLVKIGQLRLKLVKIGLADQSPGEAEGLILPCVVKLDKRVFMQGRELLVHKLAHCYTNFILPPMNRNRAQKMVDEFQEGTYTKRRGRTHNTGKPYKGTPSQSSSSQQLPPVEVRLPPVEVRHHGHQNDLGMEPDYSMHLDPSLPTEEEVRGSYGNVFTH